MSQVIITTKQAAQILGMTQENVARLLRIGRLEGTRLGRDWAVYRSSVEDYREQTEGKTKHDPTRGQR